MEKKTRVNCLVCDSVCLKASHFDAISCAACAAFFRRSVAEGHKYLCRNSDACKIEQGIKYKKTCRACRFQKCLDVGMNPEKVQKIWKNCRDSSVPSVLPGCVEIGDIDVGLREISHIYLAHKEQRQQQYNSLANTLNPPLATLRQLLITNKSEPHFALRFVRNCASKTNFTDADRMALLKHFTHVSRVAEQSLLMAAQDSRRLNQYVMMDGSFLPATLTGFAKLYEEFPPSANSPSFLARITMSSVDYQMEVLVSSMEYMNLDDTEAAVLLNLILFDPDILGLSLKAQETVLTRRREMLNNLHEYYKNSRQDIAIRFGNLVHLLSPIKECARQRQEAFQVFRLASAPILKDLLKANETD